MRPGRGERVCVSLCFVRHCRVRGHQAALDFLFRQEIEHLALQTRRRLGIERTSTGWRIAYPDRVAE